MTTLKKNTKKYNNMNCNYDFVEAASLSHPDRNVRLILTKFRLSDHKLLIEIGRYLKIPRDQKTMCELQCLATLRR
jgi:hypothetical protein